LERGVENDPRLDVDLLVPAVGFRLPREAEGGVFRRAYGGGRMWIVGRTGEGVEIDGSSGPA